MTISDYLTGTFAAEAVLAALYRRDRPDTGTGIGGVVDAPLYGAVLRILEWTVAAQDRLGLTRERQGNRLANSAPSTTTPRRTAGSSAWWARSDANFRRLCRAMGRPELADDPRWRTLRDRVADADGINDLVAEWAAALTAREVEEVCVANGVPVGVAYDAAEIIADPHVVARGDLVEVDDPFAGPHLQQAPFPRLDRHRPVPRPRHPPWASTTARSGATWSAWTRTPSGPWSPPASSDQTRSIPGRVQPAVATLLAHGTRPRGTVHRRGRAPADRRLVPHLRIHALPAHRTVPRSAGPARSRPASSRPPDASGPGPR